MRFPHPLDRPTHGVFAAVGTGRASPYRGRPALIVRQGDVVFFGTPPPPPGAPDVALVSQDPGL